MPVGILVIISASIPCFDTPKFGRLGNKSSNNDQICTH